MRSSPGSSGPTTAGAANAASATHPSRVRDTQPRRYRGLTAPRDGSTEVGALPLGHAHRVRVAELVLEYLKVLVWPVVVVLVVYMFRQRLHDLLARITSFEGPGGVKAAFAEEVAQVQGRLHHAEAEQKVTDQPPSKPSTDAEFEVAGAQARVATLRRSTQEHLTQLRERTIGSGATAPAISLAWNSLEAFFREVATEVVRRGAPMANTSVDTVLGYMRAEDLIDAVRDLRRLKDGTLGRFQLISASEAESYVRAVEDVIRLTSDAVQSRLAGRPTDIDIEGD